MNPMFALVVFYALIALAVVVLRGDLTDWSRTADQVLSLLVVLLAVALLLGAWRPTFAHAKRMAGSPSRPMWWGWVGIAALLTAVYLAVLGPASVWVARPVAPPRAVPATTEPEALPPPPTEVPGEATLPHAGEGLEATPSTQSAPNPDDASTPSVASAPSPQEAQTTPPSASWWQNMMTWFRQRGDWWRWALVAVTVGLCGWLLYRLWGGRDTKASAAREVRPWFDDPTAPAYVREFLKLCHACACEPVPGDTLARLLKQLQRRGQNASALHALTEYHYRVCYEGVPSEPATEQNFTKVLRALRKAVIPVAEPAANIREAEEEAEPRPPVQVRRRKSESRSLTDDEDY